MGYRSRLVFFVKLGEIVAGIITYGDLGIG